MDWHLTITKMHIFSFKSVVAIFSLSLNKIKLVLCVLLVISVAIESLVVQVSTSAKSIMCFHLKSLYISRFFGYL